MNCPECDDFIQPEAKRCKCGWVRAQPKTTKINPKYLHLQKILGLKEQSENNSDYENRINNIGKKHLNLPIHEQEYIKNAAADGFHYHGDEFKIFVRFYDEYQKMRALTTQQKRDYYMGLVDAMPDRSIPR